MPRCYPLERVCCAVAYLLTLPEERMRTAGLRVIEAQISRAHALVVKEAFARAVQAARSASTSRARKGGSRTGSVIGDSHSREGTEP